MLIFFWLTGGGDGLAHAALAGRDRFHGIRPLSPAMLRRMERRVAQRALEARRREQDDEDVLFLLVD